VTRDPRPDAGQDLVRSVVDLAEILDQFNHHVRREAERRGGIEPVPQLGVVVLMHLLRRPPATIKELAAVTDHPTAAVRQVLHQLERSHLVSSTGGRSADTRYTATTVADEVRGRAREQSARRVRYALSTLSAADLAQLVDAREALGALSRALGFREVVDGPGQPA
jgi:DNA-binding MarR family transcriptional regulator